MTSPVPEPDVVNILKQPKGNVTYRILSYGPLSKAQMIKIVDEYYARPGRKRPANGTTVTIMTTHDSA